MAEPCLRHEVRGRNLLRDFTLARSIPRGGPCPAVFELAQEGSLNCLRECKEAIRPTAYPSSRA